MAVGCCKSKCFAAAVAALDSGRLVPDTLYANQEGQYGV